jgi:prepilin-type N-terminal cleavage/methylation domain-containing protein
MREKGFSLVELVAVLLVIAALSGLAAPWFRAYLVEARLLGAGRVFKSEFLRARSIAVRSAANTAIRFEQAADGAWFYSVYLDGNHNGVLAADIARGIDPRIGVTRRLDGGAAGVWVGIHEGVQAPPPDSGVLDPGRPIQFGRSFMVSFSPMGTATPGTFYLAGEAKQAAVRVTPGTARVRLMIWSGGRWAERS